ncbi:protein argonaute-2-like isoform X2 [Plodia interpunctella]|uniref:protein argonaute-2-like isoform X2 n=1 Tax=Plodia interpunctella TaxID=58824 RepID=UPI00236835FE|nr:protein argonaute-2-like isoform X2 [Plodia interpunctella]
MGRGGKNRNKKKQEDEPPSVAGLSLNEPSTSASQPEASALKSELVSEKSKESTPGPETKQEDDDEGGLGLGVGGGRKKKPKKKPAAQPAAPASAPPRGAPAPAPSTAPVTPAEPHPTSTRPQLVQSASDQEFVKQPKGPPSFRREETRPPAEQPPPYQPPTSRHGPASHQPHDQGHRDVHQSEKYEKPSGPICRFKVPKKIEGKSVPSFATSVYCNYLEMNFKDLNIARYDISFKPEVKKLIPKAFEEVKKKHFPKSLVAFDQVKNCYTLKPLPGVPETERFCTSVDIIDNNGRTVKFEISFKFTGNVSLNRIRQYMTTGGTSLCPPSEAIQCVDVILRQGALESYVKAGRQFFKRPSNPIDLSGGLEMWTGLFQSAIFTSKAFINIDVAHKGFPKYQPLIITLSRDFQLDPSIALEQQNRRNVELFQQFLKGLRVVAAVGGDTTAQGQRREFVCNSTVKPATVEKFDFTDPNTNRCERITVAEFFIKKKGFRLRYPNLNCVWVGARDKSIYYPMELLEVAFGQALNRQLNENQLRTMVMKAATPPDQRKRKIEEIIKDMNYSNNQFFKEFGLNISNKFYEVEAKVLRPPELEIGAGKVITPKRGEWRTNTLLRAEAMQNWGIMAVDIAPNSCDFPTINQMIVQVARKLGMNVAEPQVRRTDVTMRNLAFNLDDAAKKGAKLVFVIVGTRSRDLYHRVKQIAEREVGILTQCIKENTASRRINEQTIQNILLKVNSKLMGINQAIPDRALPRCLQGGGVMVVGADVTHPSPDQSAIPSIAAVTASIDPKCYIYNIELSIQTPKKEMIVQFEDMMVDHLKMYARRLRVLPRKIFVFRDGVSEGQFAEVMNSELQAVHNAYARLSKTTKPEVLFLLVQKRHHTRLFQKNCPNYNVEPGTVVDKDIVHASELDFYLVSHQAIKGTARPTRYHAVCNDGNIRHDEVEQLTFYLCHLFSRCSRSVSYPTPTYYAHLACLRARSLTHGETFDNDELERNPHRLRVLENIWNVSPMFFV